MRIKAEKSLIYIWHVSAILAPWKILAQSLLPPHKAIYGLDAALAHIDGHISMLLVDCISYF